MLPELIETERLRLRSFAPRDRAAVEQGLGTWEVARMMTSVPHPYPPDGFETFLRKEAQEREAGGGTYAVERDGAVIGGVGLNPHDEGLLALGYWIAPETWGHGLASEAASAARDAAFAQAGVPALFSRRIDDNPASGRILEKLGFVETGSMQHWSESRRARVTSITYRLDRNDWLRRIVLGTPVLRTGRLLLRPLQPEDAAPIAHLAGDIEVARWMALLPHPYTLRDAEQFLTQSAARVGRGDELEFAMLHRGELVGIVGVGRLRAAPRIGWWLGRPYWGQGLMSEAVEAVLQHLFSRRGVDTVEAGAFPENAASLRIQEKMGFVVTGNDVRHCLALDRELPHVVTELTRDAFARRAGGRPQ